MDDLHALFLGEIGHAGGELVRVNLSGVVWVTEFFIGGEGIGGDPV